MNIRTALAMMLLALALAACGNKGPLVQAPTDTPVEAPIEMPAEDTPVDIMDDDAIPIEPVPEEGGGAPS